MHHEVQSPGDSSRDQIVDPLVGYHVFTFERVTYCNHSKKGTFAESPGRWMLVLHSLSLFLFGQLLDDSLQTLNQLQNVGGGECHDIRWWNATSLPPKKMCIYIYIVWLYRQFLSAMFHRCFFRLIKFTQDHPTSDIQVVKQLGWENVGFDCSFWSQLSC